MSQRFRARSRWGVVIIAVALLLALALAAAPYVWRDGLADQVAEKHNEVRLLAARISAAEQNRAPAIAAGDSYGALFVAGSTTGLAMATLQRHVANLAQQNGMELERTQALQAEEKDGVSILRMEAEATGSLEAVRGYLLALEAGDPLLFITAAKISVPPGTDAGSAALPSDRLTVALRLEAYGTPGGSP